MLRPFFVVEIVTEGDDAPVTDALFSLNLNDAIALAAPGREVHLVGTAPTPRGCLVFFREYDERPKGLRRGN